VKCESLSKVYFKGLNTWYDIAFVFQGQGKPLLFLIRTFPEVGVSIQSNASMAIQQGSGMLSL
jgi:hypothetical protein